MQQLAAALAVTVFPALGALGIVAIRFLVASFTLCLVVRPSVRGLTARHWAAVVALASALTAMSLLFYNASGRIPLGIAVTIEVCGPLLLSVSGSHRRVMWLWALLAFIGVAMLGMAGGEVGRFDAVGYLFAAGAAVGWAGYIVSSARATELFPKVDALALATLIGAVATTPFAALSGTFGAARSWPVLGTLVAVALMSSVIPHSLEQLSLRRLPPATFAILASLSPMLAAVIGWLVLGQQLGAVHYAAIALVTIASVGAVTQPSWRRDRPSADQIDPGAGLGVHRQGHLLHMMGLSSSPLGAETGDTSESIETADVREPAGQAQGDTDSVEDTQGADR
ncbi:EamA family transporter [Mycobacterium sp. OAE908]|uniref:EamA family transporter n=1 Tax=Mycobacterium sp. OAE908 TaxID=2817899 RepID=UPI001AE11805